MTDLKLLPGVALEAIAEVLFEASEEFITHPGPDGETVMALGLARGAWARRSDGSVCDWSNPEAVEVCLVGALYRVEARRPRDWVLRTETRQVVKAYTCGQVGAAQASLARWSDVHLRNRHDASSLLRSIAQAITVPF